jgi:hypothetical protein
VWQPAVVEVNNQNYHMLMAEKKMLELARLCANEKYKIP